MPDDVLDHYSCLHGLALVVCEYAVSREWVFPYDRFVEYEESDRRWAVPLGFGHWGPQQPAAYQVGNTLYVHPEIYAAIPKATREGLTDA